MVEQSDVYPNRSGLEVCVFHFPLGNYLIKHPFVKDRENLK